MSIRSRCLGMVTLAVAPLALGQSVSTERAPDPAQAAVPVAPTLYVSPFKHYRPLGEDTVGAWPETNRRAERAGGWRTYAREGQTPDNEAPAEPDPHAGHGEAKEKQP